ncbi:hypothetical protein SAMN06295987_106193 [Novosphingobium mathurense]|uniref:Nickel/cobalt transporter regulator n=2 Tax=Novosphingobium mathurense TaxID=428990 RepID=A0A1U6IH47_9SPHN|nr:hypothetical protein SAMN06295987_106193 [Novosphingobium mathurense]
MMQRILIGSVASLALIAGAASAAPGGNDHGSDHGKDRGGGKQAALGNARGPQGDVKGPATSRPDNKPAKAPGGGDAQGKPEKTERQASRQTMQSPVHDAPAKAQKHPQAGDAPQRMADHKVDKKANDTRPGNADDKAFAAGPRPPERKDIKRVTYKGHGGRDFVVPTNDRVRVVIDRRSFDWASLDRRHPYDGCPPGLAKKYNGCTPPGLAKPRDVSWLDPAWYFNDYDRSYRYRYADGYMLRLGAGDSILSYIPLLGGALGIGQVWPSTYQPVTLPTYYDSYYDLGPANGYRYYDDTIYRVDPDTSAIHSVAALLTGNDIRIGQPMPMGYDVYNVPYDYRDQYYDGPDAMYRYSDGYVYQIDPTTRLVQAAIELLV